MLLNYRSRSWRSTPDGWSDGSRAKSMSSLRQRPANWDQMVWFPFQWHGNIFYCFNSSFCRKILVICFSFLVHLFDILSAYRFRKRLCIKRHGLGSHIIGEPHQKQRIAGRKKERRSELNFFPLFILSNLMVSII